MYATTNKFATLTGVTAKALRLYETRGLLKPRRTRAGYRRYTYSDMLRLERILALKALGLPLKEIAVVTRGGGKTLDLLRRQRALLDERRQRLDRAVRAIDAITADAQPGDALHRFVGQSSWDRWEARRHEGSPAMPRVPDRASPSRVELFKRIHDALERDPGGKLAGPLVAEWTALLHREAGDELLAEAKKKRWAGRTQWPDGMRKYVASLYEMEPDAWERVAGFIEASARSEPS